MCGIFGYILREDSEPLGTQNALCQKTKEALRHRGPDGSGFIECEVNGSFIGMGHTRLAIIDLSSNAAQPFFSVDNRFVLTFNGEIYNYKEIRRQLVTLEGCNFKTESDTEVLLQAWAIWGPAALHKLVGMFAFAILDRHEKKVYLVRDAFGIKPLFYRKDDIRFAFASELAALRTLCDSAFLPKHKTIYDYLVYNQYDDSEFTFDDGVYQVGPGRFLEISLAPNGEFMGSPKLQQWWWPKVSKRCTSSFSKDAVRLRELFLNSVRLHLRSDVPLGATLSGGIDSSAVVCAMRHLEPNLPIHTFSYVARGSAVDEEYWIDLVNTHVGATPHKVQIYANDLADDLKALISAQGEPFGSTSIYAQYRVFKEAKSAGIKVMLDGQGADELLAGYKGYPMSRMRSLLEKRQFLTLYRFIQNWSQWPGRNRSEAFELLFNITAPRWLRKLRHKIKGHDRIPPSWLNTKFLSSLGVRFDNEQRVFSKQAKGRRLSEELRRTITGKGLASLLRHADRNSMHWSIESRVPFLTTEIAEFLLTLPEDYLVSDKGETKHIFREAMRGIVPDEILDRRDKIGFETPEKTFLQGNKTQIDEILSHIDDIPFIDSDRYRAKVASIINSEKSYDRLAWRMVNLIMWYRASYAGNLNAYGPTNER
jgi:asparagine synthase (glutamine-hydrolysing)